jgi:hypothetical protein
VWKDDTKGVWRSGRQSAEARASQGKEAAVPPDPLLDEPLLLPPEWEIDWDDLLLPEERAPTRTRWYSDWDEQE